MNENMTTDTPQMSSTPSGPVGNKTNMLAILGMVAVVAILAFVILQANSDSSAPVQPTPTPAVMDETLTPTATESMTETSEVSMVALTMEAGSFYYEPNQITVKKGQTVRIELTAVDMRHNFTLDEFGIESEVVAAGESVTIEFVADKVGEFEYYCNVMTHRQLGQVGTLIVEE